MSLLGSGVFLKRTPSPWVILRMQIKMGPELEAYFLRNTSIGEAPLGVLQEDYAAFVDLPDE